MAEHHAGTTTCTQPLRLLQRQTQRRLRVAAFKRIFIRIHPGREGHPPGFKTTGQQFSRHALCTTVARLITVIRDKYAFHAVVTQRRQVIGGKAVHPVSRGDVTQPGTPEGHRIDKGFTQDEVGGVLHRRLVPHPAQR